MNSAAFISSLGGCPTFGNVLPNQTCAHHNFAFMASKTGSWLAFRNPATSKPAKFSRSNLTMDISGLDVERVVGFTALGLAISATVLTIIVTIDAGVIKFHEMTNKQRLPGTRKLEKVTQDVKNYAKRQGSGISTPKSSRPKKKGFTSDSESDDAKK
mmetsp:Transcript_5125/g.9332  ORF Transcript_5125/g.9332 Transcript_5125/m.9332 type:complete len:157 (+) Transcript_5125:71-541(+)|eukprot:CAMPEP_0184699400 /NCGR_PEP_ID=MMETSP0313-20130426/5686_1 /TAXON_ID=2792 /ORGANISM="Porphyridium aerugineum, Strain SAG 1380-2" /LENGTH=156 /DNA_ID=CAMNT_0027158481 /DNA_START=77 /DNA_END=547 /DNA_ORIENTATION=+